MPPPVSRSLFKSLLLSPAVWAGAILSLLFSSWLSGRIDDFARNEFDKQVNETHLAIKARLQSYKEVLRATNAFLSSSGSVSRHEFRTYVEKLNLVEHFPGMGNVNLSIYVTAAEKENFERMVRQDTSVDPAGYPAFSIKPPGERRDYHVLTYLEPWNSNPAAFGLDMSTVGGGATKKALELGRDTGEIFSSGKIIKVKDKHQHIGLAMRMALYKPGLPIRNAEERRAAYYGSTGIGFNLHQLIKEAIGHVDSLRYMQIKVVDLGYVREYAEFVGTQEPSLLFDSVKDLLADDERSISKEDALLTKIAFPFASRNWEIEFTADKRLLLNPLDRHLPAIALIVGLLATFLLYTLFYFLASAKQQAVELANEMTKDLRRSEAHLAEAQHMAHLGSWDLDPTKRDIQWSKEAMLILKHSPVAPLTFEGFLQYVHEEDRQAVQQGLEHSFIHRSEFDMQHRIVHEDDTIRWVHTQFRPIKDDRRKNGRGMIMDITNSKITMETLQRSQDMLRELTAYQDRIKEEERCRIAREIHDELGQTLLALRIEISMLESRTNQKHPRLNARTHISLQLLDATMKSVRGIINDLRPYVLDLGLVHAIEWQVAQFRSNNNIECQLRIDDHSIEVDNHIATALFRILQESLTNILRHAHATYVAVSLAVHKEWIVLKIMDNGIGIQPGRQTKQGSYGLIGMQERVMMLGGNFSMTSTPGEGTTLLISIPYHSPGAIHPPKLTMHMQSETHAVS